MRAFISTFKFGTRQIIRDYMLLLMLVAPFLCGIVFKFLLPALDELIARELGIEKFFVHYYQLFDAILVYLVPSLVLIISSFLVLEERDDQVASYIFVTPVGFSGYILARLILPAIFAFSLAFMVLMFFKLTNITVLLGLTLALLSTLYAISSTLIVVSSASNKVEGLALTKLTGVTFLGILVPYFIDGYVQYVFALLPSFWLAKVTLEYGSNYFFYFALLGFICSVTWIIIFYRVFIRKISKSIM